MSKVQFMNVKNLVTIDMILLKDQMIEGERESSMQP